MKSRMMDCLIYTYLYIYSEGKVERENAAAAVVPRQNPLPLPRSCILTDNHAQRHLIGLSLNLPIILKGSCSESIQDCSSNNLVLSCDRPATKRLCTILRLVLISYSSSDVRAHPPRVSESLFIFPCVAQRNFFASVVRLVRSHSPSTSLTISSDSLTCFFHSVWPIRSSLLKSSLFGFR